MKRISRTGYIQRGLSETAILNQCGLYERNIRMLMNRALYKTKRAAMQHIDGPVERVRVYVEIDVENLD